jgi:hypothetical protein
MEVEKAMIVNKMTKTITAILAIVLLAMVAMATDNHEDMIGRFHQLTEEAAV